MKILKIEDIFDVIRNGATIQQSPQAKGIPITRIETTSNDRFNRDKLGYANIFDLKEYQKYILQDNDLLMSHINSEKYLGRTVLYKKISDETIIHGMNLLLLRVNQDIANPCYMNYYFKSDEFKRKVAKMTKKSVNQASFNINLLKSIELKLPTLEEQVEIYMKLDKICLIIDKKQQQLNRYDELVKSQFIEMFGDVFTQKAVHTLGDYISDKTDKVKKDYLHENIKYVDISSIDNTQNEITSYTTYKTQDRPSRAQQIVEDGDIVISTVRPNLNNVAMIKDDFENIVASTGFCVLKKNMQVNEYFIFTLVKDSRFADYLSKLTTGASYPAVSNKSVLNFKIDMPPIELQNKFADFVKHIDKLKFSETITKLKNLCYNVFNVIQSKNLGEVKNDKL